MYQAAIVVTGTTVLVGLCSVAMLIMVSDAVDLLTRSDERLSDKNEQIYMEAKLSKIYYSPQGYWKGLAAVKKKTILYS